MPEDSFDVEVVVFVVGQVDADEFNILISAEPTRSHATLRIALRIAFVQILRLYPPSSVEIITVLFLMVQVNFALMQIRQNQNLFQAAPTMQLTS